MSQDFHTELFVRTLKVNDSQCNRKMIAILARRIALPQQILERTIQETLHGNHHSGFLAHVYDEDVYVPFDRGVLRGILLEGGDSVLLDMGFP